MPKISVIVPVYNTGKYLKKCVDSILNQTMNDFEIIIVNDGSTDNSAEIIQEYVNRNPGKIKYFAQENGGLSSARNNGIKNATGNYLCFVDSDDYINEKLFESLEKYINEDFDLIKYKCIKVKESGEEIERINGSVFENKTGEDAFKVLYTTDVFIDAAWLYLYKRSFFIENKFEFPIGKYHEDWAIVPYCLLNAKSVASTNIFGYYYVQSDNSITRNKDEEKAYKRAFDMLEHYDNLIGKISNSSLDKKVLEYYKTYMTNCLILKIEDLPKKYIDTYIKELKTRKVVNNIKVKNLKQLIKRIILKINMKLYLKIR